MDKEALKASYKVRLEGGPEAGSKGASVGFIEIARHANKPIDFDFVDVDDAHACFALRAFI